MERYFKRKSETTLPSEKNSKVPKSRLEFNSTNLQTDPELRTSIQDCNPNFWDQIQREYMQMGPCQPIKHNFPFSKFGKVEKKQEGSICMV